MLFPLNGLPWSCFPLWLIYSYYLVHTVPHDLPCLLLPIRRSTVPRPGVRKFQVEHDVFSLWSTWFFCLPYSWYSILCSSYSLRFTSFIFFYLYDLPYFNFSARPALFTLFSMMLHVHVFFYGVGVGLVHIVLYDVPCSYCSQWCECRTGWRLGCPAGRWPRGPRPWWGRRSPSPPSLLHHTSAVDRTLSSLTWATLGALCADNTHQISNS